VTAASGDYDASQVDNDSGVAGADVALALDALDAGKAAASHVHAAADVTSGELPDARVADDLTVESSADLGTDLCVRIGSRDTDASATCICRSASDRLYHDTDCDGVQDAGEEAIDHAPTAGTLTVEESDGTPSVTASEIRFDQSSGLSVTDEGGGAVTVSSSGGGGLDGVVVVEETDGGSASSGVWNTRTLDAIPTNTVAGASLSTGDLTLPSGTYLVSGGASCHRCLGHNVRLLDVGTSMAALVGVGTWADNGADGDSTMAIFDGILVLGATTTLRFQHFTASGLANSFNGDTANMGPEARIVFVKLQ
jgi:hypothetical protein